MDRAEALKHSENHLSSDIGAFRSMHVESGGTI